MEKEYIKNEAKLSEQLARFTHFVKHMDGYPGFISFRDSRGFLGREEDYKSRIAEKTREALKYGSWKESWIGTGKIAICARNAVSKCGNLINKHKQIELKNNLDINHPDYKPEAERVLFDIYCNQSCEERVAFENAIKVFGASYPVIAFWFFVKDDVRFLPVSPERFDKSFISLDIEHKTSHQCEWENYQDFIGIISDIREVMEDMLPMQGTPRLIDAHSFVWIIQEDKYVNWEPDSEQSVQIEQLTEDYIRSVVSGNGGRRRSVSNVFKRSAKVVKQTLKMAHGICKLCNQPAPFNDKNGKPYLEVHHIEWLSRGGKDSTENTAALCPNCHARMHVIDDTSDVNKLRETIVLS
ncbi:MAG: HNH endonuclease [Lachnospiraceae bacterium]|nr:HNH endonuclease [Lachnospiraceae bacterium]